MSEAEAMGNTLIEAVNAIIASVILDEAFPRLVSFLVQAWFAFVRHDTRGPELDLYGLSNSIRGQMEGIRKVMGDHSLGDFSHSCGEKPQPNLRRTFIEDRPCRSVLES